MGKKAELGAISVNIGSIYFDKKTPAGDSSAKAYFNDALQAYGNDEGIQNVYNAIGKLYFREAKYDLSLQNHNKALEFSEKLNNKLSVVKSLTGLGNVSLKMGDYRKAIAYCRKAGRQRQEMMTAFP